MLANPDVLLEKANGENDYRRNVRAAVRGLWNGSLPLFMFVQSLNATVYRGLIQAFYDGARQVGIYETDLTDDERFQLSKSLLTETNWVEKFGRDIENARERGGKLGPLLDRAEMWVLRYESFRSWAMSLVGGDQKLKWEFGPTEHCSSCSKLHGRVYRSSIWKKYNLYPRHRSLECKGFRCQCRFSPTNDRVTPGRPPSIP